MKSHLAVLTIITVLIMLFSFGCEPETETSTPTPQPQAETKVEPQQESAEIEAQAVEEEMGISDEIAEETTEMAEEAVDHADEATDEHANCEHTKNAREIKAEHDGAEIIQPDTVKDVAEDVVVELKPIPQPSPNDVIGTVNGQQVTVAQVDELASREIQMVKTRAEMSKIPDDQIQKSIKNIRSRALDFLITEKLVEGRKQQAGIKVTDQEVDSFIETEILAKNDMTLEVLKSRVTADGTTYEQWKKKSGIYEKLALDKLIEADNFGGVDVNESEVLDFYNENKMRFAQPEMVKASHILIKPVTDANIPAEQADADAKAKAQDLLKQVKEGADFAELAKANSACPSAERGGDLGFSHKRAWVPPFSNAAFSLQPGQVYDDVVKTQFGYHIIMATDKKEATTQSYDEVKDMLMSRIKQKKTNDLIEKYIEHLKGKAQIDYAEGYAPQPKLR